MAMSDDDLLKEQRLFYRARAPECDEWGQRRVWYDRAVDETVEWHRQLAVAGRGAGQPRGHW
jgi:hypothetical protein